MFYAPNSERAEITSLDYVARPTKSPSRRQPTTKRLRFVPETSVKPIARYVLPEEITPVDVQERTYPNGLRVVSEHVVGSASLALGLWVKVGSRNETERNNGIAHFIEHVVFKGTAGRSMRDIMRSIESRGGYLNAFTTKEHTCYYTWTRTTHLDEAVSLLFDLATRPNFNAKDIEREKAVVIEEINGLEDEPDEMVFDLFEREIFGTHPLGKPIIGTPKTIEKITRESLLTFHKRHYRPEDLLIVASGSHQHEALFASIDAATRHLKPVSRRERAESARFPRKLQTERDFPRAAGQQAHLILGRRAPGIHSKDQTAISALITLLGVGMSSRLNLKLREEMGLAYDAAAFYSPFDDTGAVGLYIATAVENRQKAGLEMRKILRGLFTRPISNLELERTKEQMIGSLVLPMESISNRMMRTATNEIYFGKYRSVEQDIAKIAALTLTEVRDQAERLFKDESGLILVSVVPEKEEEGGT